MTNCKEQQSQRRLTRRRCQPMIVGPAVVNGDGRYAEPQWIQREEQILQVKNLSATLAGARFAQISDVHVGACFISCITTTAH